MEPLVRMLIAMPIALIPTAVITVLIFRSQRSRLSRSEAPFREMRRRPPGETIRLRLAEFDERIASRIVMLVAPPIMLALVMAYVRFPGWTSFLPTTAMVLTVVIVAGVGLHRAIRERDNYQLGFDGERFVGEELSRLIADGFEVYHDVPFDGFNMDHVLVGPAGVYVVETKTRRKPKGKSGEKHYRVEYDGSCLRWPWGSDTHGLEQTKNNARTLSQWLSSAVGEPVYVIPILTLPGWMIDRTVSQSPVNVLNPKQIRTFCRDTEQKLTENLLRRICHQLDQKCRLGVVDKVSAEANPALSA